MNTENSGEQFSPQESFAVVDEVATHELQDGVDLLVRRYLQGCAGDLRRGGGLMYVVSDRVCSVHPNPGCLSDGDMTLLDSRLFYNRDFVQE